MAARLGRTRDELLSTMTAAEFALWRELWRIEPWGEAPADERMAHLAAAFNRSMGGKATPGHYRIVWTPPEPRQPTVDFKTGILALAARTKRK